MGHPLEMSYEILMHNHAYLFDVTELVCYFSLIFLILGPIYMNLSRGGVPQYIGRWDVRPIWVGLRRESPLKLG